MMIFYCWKILEVLELSRNNSISLIVFPKNRISIEVRKEQGSKLIEDDLVLFMRSNGIGLAIHWHLLVKIRYSLYHMKSREESIFKFILVW